VDKPLKSVTHGQCDARPMGYLPSRRTSLPTTGTKLYCVVTEAHVCEQLVQGHYDLTAARPVVELVTWRVVALHSVAIT